MHFQHAEVPSAAERNAGKSRNHGLRPFLERQIELIDPEVIVAWGNPPRPGSSLILNTQSLSRQSAQFDCTRQAPEGHRDLSSFLPAAFSTGKAQGMAGLVLNTRYFELTTMKETIFDSLPVIGKSLAEIKPSDKYREKCPAGSALAMSIAQNAVQLKKQNKLLTVICADPSDVIRLQDEVTWFDPSLKLTVFPDWKPCLMTC